jgi:RNA polymerase sigma-70 factor (ECF subfamily)
VLFSFLKPESHFEELTQSEFQQLFKELYKPVRNFVYFRCSDPDVADDIAQDVFVKLWETRGRIDRKTVKAYLYTIAQNLTVNYHKKKQLHFKFTHKPTADREFDTPEKLTEMKEYEHKLSEVLALLPEGGREVFLMNRLEDLTYTEIADRLGLSVKAVEKRMSKVLRIFREKLGKEI